ncbi:MAG: glycosyltransferase family 4 protein [Chthonomonadales bacterium]|nr:glycosyltransferase family 4 protein [Chthonomonadales bacterium]
MTRVLILANDHTTIYNFRRELLERLVADGYQIDIALPADPRNEAFRRLGCRVLETRLSRFGTNPFEEFATLVRYTRLIGALHPDVVLTYTAKPNIYGGIASQIHRVPYLTTITGVGTVFQSDGLLKRVSVLLQRLALRCSARVFFQNNANLRTFQELGIVRENFALLPGSGVNLSLHGLEPYAPDDGVVRFITVSRLRQDKGFGELFAAITSVCAVRDDVEFHIVGWYEDDTYRDVVQEMQQRFPVTVHGTVSQERVHELIAGSHCLIHPSHHEGMANVLLEAAAAGVPSITSDIPGCREAVDGGGTGFLIPVRDAAALASEIERLADLPWAERREMGLAARRKMEAEFDRQGVVDRYLQEIQCVLRREQRVLPTSPSVDLATGDRLAQGSQNA